LPQSNGKPQYGGAFTVAYPAEQRGFDSALVNFGYISSLHLTANTMIEGDWGKGPSGDQQADFDTSTPPLAVNKGILAERWEFVGDDTVKLYIRQGVHFALNQNSEASKLVDGREMTAEDVAFSLRRQFNMEPSVSVPDAYALSRLTPDEYPTSIEIIDKYTVEVKGKPEFLGSLFYWLSAVAIYPPEVVRKYGDLTNPLNDVGTGAFYLSDYRQNSSITFTRNDNYWETNPYGIGKGDRLPYVDSVKFLVIPDLSTRLSAFRSGQIDQIQDVSWDDFKQLTKENPNLKYKRIVNSPQGLALRSDKPGQPWHDVKVRQALQMAIDLDAIVDDYFEGEAEKLAYPIAPRKLFKSLGVYREFDTLPDNVKEILTYNPEKAKQILADAGYPDGFTIHVILKSSHVDLASILQNQLQKIGVTLDLQVREDSVYTSIASSKSHEEGIFVEELTGAPQAFHEFRPTDPGNTAMIDDPTTNKMIAEFAEDFMVNDEEAWPRLGEYTPYILEQAWYLFLPVPYTYTVWQPWVQNYNGENSIGAGHFGNYPRYIWIDRELKKTLGK
jgi:peptide/nickel transport system substrate-binding protein